MGSIRAWIPLLLGVFMLSTTFSVVPPASAAHPCVFSAVDVYGAKDKDAHGNRGQIQVIDLFNAGGGNFQYLRVLAPNQMDHIDVGWTFGDQTGGLKQGFWFYVEGDTIAFEVTHIMFNAWHNFKIIRDRALNRWYTYINFDRTLTLDTGYSHADPFAIHTIDNTCNEGNGHFRSLRFAVNLDSRTYWFDWSNTQYGTASPYCLEVISDKEFKTHGPAGHDPQCP